MKMFVVGDDILPEVCIRSADSRSLVELVRKTNPNWALHVSSIDWSPELPSKDKERVSESPFTDP